LLCRKAEDLQSQHSVSTRVVPADLSQDDFLPVIKQATDNLQIGLLVNNAGNAEIHATTAAS
jgi:short-subunit dehydrogenase